MSTKSTTDSKTSNSAISSPNAEFRAIFGANFEEHFPTHRLSPFGIGGVADYLVRARTTSELMQAVDVCLRHHLSYVVLGRGTNVIFSQVGFPGTVIVNQTSTLSFDKVARQVRLDAGVSNDELVNAALGRSLGGVEFLASIPGTVGGALATLSRWGNRRIDEITREVVVYLPEGETARVVTLTASEFFSANIRHQLATHQPPVVLTARLQLTEMNQEILLRRVRDIRKNKKFSGQTNIFGHVFTEPIIDTHLAKEDWQVLKKLGLRLESESDQLFSLKSRPLKPENVRTVFTELLQRARVTQPDLDLRLQFLGYWPDDGQKEGE